jgi:hypothetical protein
MPAPHFKKSDIGDPARKEERKYQFALSSKVAGAGMMAAFSLYSFIGGSIGGQAEAFNDEGSDESDGGKDRSMSVYVGCVVMIPMP